MSCLMSVAECRVRKELREMLEHPYPHPFVRTVLSSPFQSHFTLFLPLELTPASGPFAHQVFICAICVPAGYPFRPPWVQVRNGVPHPNVEAESGAMRLRVLGLQEWSRDLTLHNVVFALQEAILKPDVELSLGDTNGSQQSQLSVSPCSLKRKLDSAVAPFAKRPKLHL